MTKKTFVLLSIFIIGFIFRFYRLGDVPLGFHRDEAFLGYNAYSILKTGRDMTGNFLPLHLESFIYSPAGYSYLSIPFIRLFDLNAFAVRFASALFGSLTVLLTYFLARELFSLNPKSEARNSKKIQNSNFQNQKQSETRNLKLGIPVIAAAMLAISPWHINLSRTGTENVLVVFFIMLGTLLFILWIKKDKLLLLVLSFLSFGLTLLIYQAPRAFLPLFIPLLLFLFLGAKKERERLLASIVLFSITIILPLMLVLSSNELTLRIRTVSLFATKEVQLTTDEAIREDGLLQMPTIIARAYHNKVVGFASQVIENYFSHFTFDFLFTDKGLPIRYKVPNFGLLYLFELPLLLLGIWSLLRNGSKVGAFILSWVVLAPIGSALTFDDIPNTQRTLLVFPALSIIVAVGIYESYFLLRKQRRFLYPISGLIIVVMLYSITYYLHQYYVHQLVHQSWFRHEGYKELVTKVNTLLPSYEAAVITNRESAPTIFFLFYGKYNPSTFQEETKKSAFRDFDRIGFGKYKFSEEECPLIEFEDVNRQTGETQIVSDGEKDVLYVNYGTCKIPETTARLLEEIRRKDGSLVFRILERTGKK